MVYRFHPHVGLEPCRRMGEEPVSIDGNVPCPDIGHNLGFDGGRVDCPEVNNWKGGFLISKQFRIISTGSIRGYIRNKVGICTMKNIR